MGQGIARAGIVAAALAIAAAPGTAQQARSFYAEGSDTIQAVGARHIAMGGTGTATANDPYAVFYNPARLVSITDIVVSGTRQLDATLQPVTFIGAAVPLDFFDAYGFDVTLGVARYNRVHARSSGAFGANEPESIFLRYLLPGISGTFDGDIDSKTLVNRFAVGLSHEAIPGLSIGANVDWIDCKTETCGVHGTSNGVESRSVHATALSFGVGASYEVNDKLTLAVAFTDINTVLDVDVVTTDDAGTRPGFFRAQLPKKLNIEAAYQLNDRLLVAAGYQKFWGTYGNYSLNFETVMAGVEWRQNDWLTLRGGALGLIDLSASNGLSLNVPFRVAPTAGVGVNWGNMSADLGVYVHPIMTLHAHKPSISADLSVSYRF